VCRFQPPVKTPLVSIIIPCFNGEAFVGDAIQSALAQSYPQREVIVIDDGSTDGSLDVIRSFGDQVRWETGPNRGGCAARNLGLQLSCGKFIQFLDADDLLHPDKLERQVPLAVRSHKIVYCRWETQSLSASAGQLHCSRFQHQDPVVLVVTRVITTSAPLYPKSRLDQIGGWCESLSCAQDHDLNLRLAAADAEFVEIPDVLMTLRRRASSVSADVLPVIDQVAEVNRQVLSLLQRDGRLTEERSRAFAESFARMARIYARHRRLDKARRLFSEARCVHTSGGLDGAYGEATRWLLRLVGPEATELLVHIKRQLSGVVRART
jgi:glycosyltransferase involved in cell wall biosynthesis